MGEPADRAGEQCRQHVISAGGRGAGGGGRSGGSGGARGSARSYIFARLWPDDGRNFPHLRRSGSQRCLDNRICSRLDCRRPVTGVFVDAGYRRDHGYNHASLTDRSEAVSMSSLSISLNACARVGGGGGGKYRERVSGKYNAPHPMGGEGTRAVRMQASMRLDR